MMATKLNFAPMRSIGFIAALLIVLILGVQFSVAWYGLEIVKDSKEQDFNRHLEDVGKIAQPLLRDAAVDIAEIAVQAVPPSSSSDAADATPGSAPRVPDFSSQVDAALRDPFTKFAQRARLKSLTLLDTKGQVLLSTTEPARTLIPFEFLDLDRDQFESALRGKTGESLAYSVDTAPVKRVYVPISDVGRTTVAAVICLTAGRGYLEPLGRLQKKMSILSSISTVLVLIIGWLMYRLLVRQRAYEQRAAHTDRLTSLGSLAAGFAHEVRNPLEIISACTEDLERVLAETRDLPADALESCRDIMEEVDRLNRLVGQFLQYSKADSHRGAPGSASVSDCISSAIAMLRHTAEKQNVSIVWNAEADAETARVALDDSSLRQIVINLVMNAIQATPAGGRIEIHAETEPRIFRLSVFDTGPGVPAAIRSRIFDPFFTTREEGSGLGLSIAHQLAVRAGGKLTCEERPAGAGSCFILELPRVVAARSVAAGVAEALTQ